MPSKMFAEEKLRSMAFVPAKHFKRTSLSFQSAAQFDIMKTLAAPTSKLMSWCRCNLHFLFLEVLDLMVDNSVCNQHSSHDTWGKLDRNGSGVQIFLGCLSHPTVFVSRIYFGKRKAQPFPHIVEQGLGLDKLKRQALPFDAMMPLTSLWRRAHQAGDGTGHKLWNKCELFSYFCTYMPQQHGLNC